MECPERMQTLPCPSAQWKKKRKMELSVEELHTWDGVSPFICKNNSDIEVPGMVFPPVGSEAADFEAIIGGDRLVTMLQLRDCRELILSLSDWTKFFTADKETNEMSILSLDVTRTPLFELLAIPDCIKDLDILTTVGRLDENLFVDGRGEKPKNKSCNPISNLLGYHGGGMYAAVVKSLQGDSFKTSAGLTSDLDT